MKVTNSSIQEALNWRYAVKKFDPSKKISQEDWNTLAKSLLLAPSSYGMQPWKFLVIENPETRNQLRPASWNQSQITDASHLVVFVAKEKITDADVDQYIKRIQEVRGVSLDSLAGLIGMLRKNLVEGLGDKAQSWTQRQAYIAMGFLLETAALLQIDSTPMEGLEPSAYDKILKIEGTGWKTVAAVALGYRHAEDGFQSFKKVRYPENEVIQYLK